MAIPNSDNGGYTTPAAPRPRPTYNPGPPNYPTYRQPSTPAPRVAAGNAPGYNYHGTGYPGTQTRGTIPGAGASGATQARQEAAAAAAYAATLKKDWGSLGAFGGGLNNSGINLPNINNPSGGGPNLPSGPSGGGSGIPGAGGGIGTIPPAPKAPALDTYLKSDASYQNQLRTFAQALAEFQAGQKRSTASDNTSWQGATRQLGEQKTKDLAGIMNDFASRGMLKSGLYGQGIADYQKTYQNNLNDLNTGHSNALRDLGTANVNFQKDQAIQSAQARSDAAARRAAQFGL